MGPKGVPLGAGLGATGPVPGPTGQEQFRVSSQWGHSGHRSGWCQIGHLMGSRQGFGAPRHWAARVPATPPFPAQRDAQ